MAKPKVVKKANARGTKRVRSAKRPARKAPAAPRTARGKAPAAPAPAVPSREEAAPPRDIPRLTRYGERFGPHRIDTRMLPQLLPIGSSALALFDPRAPDSWRVLDRPVGGGNSRVMLSVSRPGPDAAPGGRERAAALVVYVGHAQIARWTAAGHRGATPSRGAGELPRCTVTSGWLAIVDAGGGAPGVLEVPAPGGGVAPVELALPDGRRAIAVPCGKGAYAAYWAVDAADKPVCLVVDLDVFTQKEWKAKPA